MQAIVVAVTKFRHYLLGQKFTIRTDHKSLKELQSQVIQTSEQRAWLAKLLGYDFSIEYKVGTDNQGADGLSRAFLSITALTSSWIPILQQELQHLKPLNEFIVAELKMGHLTIRKGLWFWKDKLFIPANSTVKKQLL